MPAVTRRGDMGTGHADWPARASVGGSGDVFVNGIPVHRNGDGWAVHCNPPGQCHASALAGGSSTVFANGKGGGRVGDAVACGSKVATGSGNVFAG
ncbi:PAAR domain-containing protein [Tropicimonas sp. IMCC34043]|uniref:PAAR domain-containing protein n=1 Tax=Tropicimonas sp. IMCC34043 TaxID=2248760 RepID=UPI000E288E95|nr:PAAR domain-containing protein [Tropicimonas sp. IMCC34043]